MDNKYHPHECRKGLCRRFVDVEDDMDRSDKGFCEDGKTCCSLYIYANPWRRNYIDKAPSLW